MTSLAEGLFGPGVLVALALSLPLALKRLLELVLRWSTGRALSPDGRARLALGVCMAALFLSAGRRALGPSLVDSPNGPASLVFGALLACVSFVILVRGGTKPGATGIPSPALEVTIGAAVGVALLAAWSILLFSTRIDSSDISTAGVDAARLRLQLDPWDETATLALGWAAREAEELARAEALADAALEMGAALDDVLELRIEVFAAEGRCDEANASFERALEERSRRAFDEETILSERLELGGYRLPPTYVSACGVTPRAE